MVEFLLHHSSRTLFATHDQELTELVTLLTRVMRQVVEIGTFTERTQA